VRALVERGISIIRTCAAVEILQSWCGYESERADDVEPIERIKEISQHKPRWGCKRIYRKLRGEGPTVDHKRIERIWREYGFTLPARHKCKKVRTGQSVPVAATSPNNVWTYHFMFGATLGGRSMEASP